MENNELDFGKLMTGSVVTGVQNQPGAKPTIEVENGEYVKFPDGSVAKALGEKHENGGIKLVAPNMTEILSNTEDQTLSKDMVKRLKKEYEMKNISTDDTYSKVLDKYARKIGYTKILTQEEDLFNQVKKNTENALSEGSQRINNEYLSKKIYELQKEKAPLEEEFSNMFNVLFEKQQKGKGVGEQIAEENVISERTVPEEIEQLSEEQMFRLGGRYEEFKTMSEKHGLGMKKAYSILENSGMLLPKFPDGGIVYGVNTNENIYKNQERVHQSSNKTAYGNIADAELALTQLYRNFPVDLSNEKYKDFITIEDGKVKVKSGVNLSKVNETFKQVQTDINTRMNSSADYIINNPNKFSEDAVKEAVRYKENETFVQDPKSVRDLDAKLGQFSAGRFSLELNLVTPNDLKLLKANNISTVQQLKNNPDVLNQLSDDSKSRVNDISSNLPENSDYSIGLFQPQVPPVQPAPGEQPAQDTLVTQPIVDDIQAITERRGNKLFQMPDQRYLPPMALQAESLFETDLGRIDPVRLGIEDTIRRNQDNTQFLASQLQSLPATVSAGILSSAIAQNQQSENQAINQIHAINAQNVSQAEQFNIRQADTEEVSNNSARLNYEQRALLGLSKTDQDIRNWYNANREININNFKEQQWMNTASNLFPQFSIGFSGTDVIFDPTTKTYYRKPNPYFNQAMAIQGQPIQPISTQKK